MKSHGSTNCIVHTSSNIQLNTEEKTQYFVPSPVLSNVLALAPEIDELRQFAKDQEPVINNVFH